MIHVATKEDSVVVQYSVNSMGTLNVCSLNPKSIPSKSKFVEGNKLSTSIITTETKAKDYQSMLSAIVIESEKSVININYVSFPKTVQKPNKFEVESKRLLKF